MQQLKTTYRHDIDGLRAIAVFLVIFFHLDATYIQSGFIGVDIFFVISGYLITGIILNQVRASKFKISEFITGRLWRIQPALIFVGFVTLIFAALLYMPDDFVTFTKSEKYNSLFIANQFFARQSSTYASPESELFPLLHTWSLSIEWQWYLILPLVITLSSLLFKNHVKSRSHKEIDKSMASLWGLATIVLAAVSVFIAMHKPEESYYFLSTRAFEFTAGGTAFIATRLFTSINNRVFNILSLCALILIFSVSLKGGVIDVYPNYYTFVVVLATAMVLFVGQYQSHGVYRFLSLPCVTYLGRLSFSLYLWHWPVMSFFRYVQMPLQGTGLLIAFILIAVLSLFGFYCVEMPLRKRRKNLWQSIIILALIPIVLYSVIYSLTNKNDGYPQRLGKDFHQQTVKLNEYRDMAAQRSNCLGNSPVPEECITGDLNGNRKAILIGDSNSNHFWNFFDVLGKNAHMKITAVSESSCLTLPEIWQYDWWVYKNKKYQACHDSTEDFYKLIKENKYDYVIIGEVWENYISGPHIINNDNDERSDELTKKRIRTAAFKAMDIITTSGATPVIIKTIYSMPTGYQECLKHAAVLRQKISNLNCGSTYQRNDENLYLKDLFKELAQKYPNLVFIDPKDVQCPENKCITQIDTLPVYRDVGHLTDFASYWLGKSYLNIYGNPLKSN